MLELDPEDVEKHREEWLEAEQRALMGVGDSGEEDEIDTMIPDPSLGHGESPPPEFTKADFMEALEKSARPFGEEKSET